MWTVAAPGTGKAPRLRLRASVAGVVVVGLFSMLAFRLWSLQVVNGQGLRQRALAVTTRDVPVAAARGEILARGGQVLAGDRAQLVVTLKTAIDASTTPATRVADPTAEANLVALLPGLTLAKLRAELNDPRYEPFQPVAVATVGAAAAATIIEHPKAFPGAAVTKAYVRDYPQGPLAAQQLGFVGPLLCTRPLGSAACAAQQRRDLAEGYQPTDLVGAAGLEAAYEPALRGRDGLQRLEVDPAGAAVGVARSTPPRSGDDLVLNLDLPLERTLSSALAAHVAQLDASGLGSRWAAGVVLDARTGAVLAIASYPTYDDNLWVGGISAVAYRRLLHAPGGPLNDYAITGLEPPGSTFKLVTATAALDDGLISPSTIIDDPGYIVLPGGLVLSDAPGDSPGIVDASEAITISSDVFFYTLGERFWLDRRRYGRTPIQDMAARYGLGQDVGIDLPGAATGWVDSLRTRALLHRQAPTEYPPASWYLADNVELAFGQGRTVVSPLELATAYATFANGGTRYAPEMAAAVLSPRGRLVRRIAPKVMAHVPLPPVTRSTLLSGFEGAVQSPVGTAYAAFVGFPFDRWLMAGKTGTATTSTTPGVQPTAWFVGFGGPKGSRARYVAAVEVDHGGYGASGAAPVVRQVFDELYARGLQQLAVPRRQRSDGPRGRS